jgi:hypothetical protein
MVEQTDLSELMERKKRKERKKERTQPRGQTTLLLYLSRPAISLTRRHDEHEGVAEPPISCS